MAEMCMPVQLAATLQLEATVYVSLSIDDDALRIHAPFGDIVIPFTRVTKVAQEPGGEIRLDVKGTTFLLHVGTILERNGLSRYIEERATGR